MAERDKDRRAGPAEPFRIAGNFYYVGANDVSAFLITGPEGHVVIDGGYPTTAPMIIASIAKLGFDIKDVKVLLNHSRTPTTGAGWRCSSRRPAPNSGRATRARLPRRRRRRPRQFLPMRALVWVGVARLPAHSRRPSVQGRRHVRLGPIALTAHITAGHTRGCTSWSFPVRDGDRVLNVVSACDPGATSWYRGKPPTVSTACACCGAFPSTSG